LLYVCNDQCRVVARRDPGRQANGRGSSVTTRANPRDGAGLPGPGRLRWRRLAETVADQIRGRILAGELAEGDVLPKESELRRQYPVNVQSLREALRILESEGLVRVRRGNRGGAVVHRPDAGNVA